jgi:filamin
MHFRVETLTKELELSQINAFIVPPQSSMQNVRLDSRGDGVYIPEKYGMHEIVLEVGEDR